ncbi:hypothetical protein LMH73_010280 [Vibrio splendidus]|nr:hypothetical protein [Vibrio splendidus]MCC4882740.1 hypothetical protein [Vibrio splendidus]
MSGIEVFGSKCPCCKKPFVWSKIESSNVALQFDACLDCGFIDWVSSDVRNDGEQTKAGRIDLWEMLLSRNNCSNLMELKAVMVGYGVDENPETAFDHSGYSQADLEAKRVPEPSFIVDNKLSD